MTNRTSAYRFTVKMENGKPVAEQAHLVENLRKLISEENSIFVTQQYVKIQGRLGKNNPASAKYGLGKQYYNHQAIRLSDASTGDVYVYNR